MENNNRDEKLWQLASQRAGFKAKVFSYVGVNLFLWAIWFITNKQNAIIANQDFIIPWPAWVSISWGFGLLMRYIRLFHTNSVDQIQKEYDKLKGN